MLYTDPVTCNLKFFACLKCHVILFFVISNQILYDDKQLVVRIYTRKNEFSYKRPHTSSDHSFTADSLVDNIKLHVDECMKSSYKVSNEFKI